VTNKKPEDSKKKKERSKKEREGLLILGKKLLEERGWKEITFVLNTGYLAKGGDGEKSGRPRG